MFRENKLNTLANLVLVMLMSISICQTLYTSLFMTTALSLTIFLAVIPLTLLFFVMFRSKISTLISAIVLCVISITGLLSIFFNIGINNAVKWLNNYLNWFIDVCNGYNNGASPFYTNLILLLLTFLVTLLVFILSIKLYNFYIITILLFSIFFIQIQLDIFVSDISFILFLFSLLLYYFFDILKLRSKELTYDIGNKLMYLICILPICLLVILFSLSLPIDDKRVSIPWLDSKFDSVINYIFEKDNANFDYFSIESAGFGEDNGLGGNINPNKTHVLNVKSDSPKLYLKASSKAFYNGHRWYDEMEQLSQIGASRVNYSTQLTQDAKEFVNGVFIETGSFKNKKIYRTSTARIEYVNLKTKSLFSPLKVTTIALNSPKTLFYDNEQIISLNDKQSKGFYYGIEYSNMFLNSNELKTILRKSYKGYYEDLYRKYLDNDYKFSAINMSSLVKFPYSADSSTLVNDKIISEKEIDSLLSKTNDIFKRYTQLPDSITPRVKQLAQNLTKNAPDDYDKAKAIEIYLSSKYTYTLKPGTPPRNKDFVDYFLFEGKKGYCTYYATAMTVLLRCIGIPSRYVEGYVMPPIAENGVFKVTNEQAHAWVEVYFEGFGWIPFEPTATYVAKMYNDTTTNAQTSKDDMLNSGYNSYLDYLNMMEKNKNSDLSGYDVSTFETTKEINSDNTLFVLIIISILIGIVLIAFILLVLINIIKSYCTMRIIRKAEPNDSILLAYSYILKVLRVQNIVYNPAETPTEFGIRVEKTFDFMSYSFNKNNFNKITNNYINARYSKALLNTNDKQAMLEFLKVLQNLTLDRMGKFKFIMAKFILSKI